MTWRIGGRLHLDAGVSATNSRAFASAFEDTFVRRAFIESYLTVAGKVEAAFQYDTAPSDLHPLQDAGVSYRGLGPLMLSVGNFKEFMSFDQSTSDSNTLSLERALSTALTPGRNFGGLAGWNGEHWTLVAGLWGGDPNTGLADEGLSGTARATVAPILTAEQVLHFGLLGQLSRPRPGQQPFRILDHGGEHAGDEPPSGQQRAREHGNHCRHERHRTGGHGGGLSVRLAEGAMRSRPQDGHPRRPLSRDLRERLRRGRIGAERERTPLSNEAILWVGIRGVRRR